ncbi:MAG: ABC transporter ATP-binding protein [Candidatus Sabulitectum sp.]|nr:ABC transporter ATP-binding protein [Candidatus Sabulitectum sp.]
MTNTAISVEGISKRFGRTQALAENFSIEVMKGQSLAILGANGAGKTTLMRAVLGLAVPDSGSISLYGLPPADPRSRIGVRFLPERISFPKWATPLQMYRQFERVRKEGREIDFIHRADNLGCGDLLNRKLGKMSKGQRQRIAVALMTCGSPKTVFLDEPSSGLDPAGRMLVRSTVAELVDRGSTVVLNSHLLGEVEKVCNWAAFIHEGALVAHDMLENLSRFKGSVLIETVDPENMKRFLGGAGTVKGKSLAYPLAEEDGFAELTEKIAQSGVQFTGIQLHRESLEDIFMRIMEGETDVS